MPTTKFTAALLTLLLASWPSPLRAGDWHNAQTACSDCHAQHNSESGLPISGNNPAGSPYALRRATSEELCLSCHDGSSPQAPNVLSTNGSYVAAAGFFVAPVTSSTHHLVKSPTVPGGGTTWMTLTCTTCHDPHGNANYRNLRPNPNPSGTLSGGVTAFQLVIANGTNPSAVYVRPNIIDKTNVSLFCDTCHGLPDPYNDHPDGKAMWGATKASYPTWACTTGVPTPPAFCTNPALRARANSPTDNTIPSQDDQVNCISCHKAHGSGQYKALYYTDGVTLDSTCLQCHNQ